MLYFFLNSVCLREDYIYDEEGNILQIFVEEDSWGDDDLEDKPEVNSKPHDTVVSFESEPEVTDIIIHSIDKVDFS